MNIEDLVKLKNEIQSIYEKEKHGMAEEKKDILKELNKVDELIQIYQVKDKEYIIMKLERLYMKIVCNLNDDEFNKLSQEERYKIFSKYFPKDWVLKYSLDKKESLLLESICNNEIIPTSFGVQKIISKGE